MDFDNFSNSDSWSSDSSSPSEKRWCFDSSELPSPLRSKSLLDEYEYQPVVFGPTLPHPHTCERQYASFSHIYWCHFYDECYQDWAPLERSRMLRFPAGMLPDKQFLCFDTAIPGNTESVRHAVYETVRRKLINLKFARFDKNLETFNLDDFNFSLPHRLEHVDDLYLARRKVFVVGDDEVLSAPLHQAFDPHHDPWDYGDHIVFDYPADYYVEDLAEMRDEQTSRLNKFLEDWNDSGSYLEFQANAGDQTDGDRYHKKLLDKQRAEIKQLRAAIRRGGKREKKFERELRKYQANADPGESSSFSFSGLWRKLKAISRVVLGFGSAVEAASDIFERLKPYVTHVLATLARWFIQPPTFTAMAIDLFILAERMNPAGVRGGLTAFMSEATKFLLSHEEEQAESRNVRPMGYTANAGEDTPFLAIGAMNALLSSTIGALSPSVSGPFLAKWGRIIKDIHLGAKSTISIAASLFQMGTEYISKWLFAEGVKSTRLVKDVDLLLFIDDYERLNSAVDSEIAKHQFVLDLLSLWRRAVEVRRHLYVATDIPREQRAILDQVCNGTHRLYQRHFVRIQDSDIPARPTPYCVAIVGPSGCGKSNLAEMLLRDMCHPSNCNMDMASSDFSQLVYCDGGTKHKDGYRGQPAYYLDDLGQKIETANTSAEDSVYLAFIKMISSTKLVLPMAHLEDKGRQFVSRIFGYTSNVIYPTPGGVESHEAIQRRRNKVIYMTVDKSVEPAYPEEAITYPNGYEEKDLQYTCFYILPSIRKNGDVVVGDKTFPEAQRPQHGQKCDGALGPYSYTELLKILVRDYNEWMATSHAQRLLTDVPPQRCGFGGAQTVWSKYAPENRYAANALEVAPRRSPQDYLDFYAQMGDWLTAQGILPRVESTVTLSQTATNLGMTYDRIAELFSDMRRRPAVLLAIALGAGLALLRVWSHLQQKKDLGPMSEDDISDFVNKVDPSIRKELRAALCKTLYECRIAQMEANVARGYGDFKPMRASPTVRAPTAMPDVVSAFKANAGLQNNADLVRILALNLRIVQLDSGTLVQGLGLCNRFMIMNEHFFKLAAHKGLVNKEDFVSVSLSDKNRVVQWRGEINVRTIRKVADDLVIVELPRQCAQFKDIRHFFISGADFGKTCNFNGWTVSIKNGFAQSTVSRMNLDMEECTYGCADGPIKVARTYRGHIAMLNKGDCGAPLVVEHLNLVCALHAASDGEGNVMMLPIWREMFDDLPSGPREELPTVELESVFETNDGEVDPIGITSPNFSNFILDKTAIVPSCVHGKVVEVRKAPSVKSLRDPRIAEEHRKGMQPLLKSFVQHFDVVRDIPSHIFAKSMLFMSAVLASVRPLPGLGRRLLNEDEVLNGVEGEYVSLNIHTSAGLPQRTYSGEPGKTGFFQHFQDEKGEVRLRWKETDAAKRFRADYVAYEALLRSDTIPFSVLLEQLKDETLKFSKIEKASTRTFEVFPGPLALVWRKYFGAFIAANQRVCAEKPISVGINAHSIQWKYLADRLSKFGGNVIAGDYQAWDKKLNGQAILGGIELVNKWYDDGPINAQVRMLLGHMIVHAYVLIGRRLFQVHQGMPSGVPVTAVLNSVCNGLYLISAILQILEECGEKLDLDELLSEIELALYGDDHIVALSHRLQKFVTFSKIAAHFHARGVGYTDSAKSERCDFDFEKLEDVTYLKRKFVKNDSVMFAPLDLVSVEDQINWVETLPGMSPVELLALRYDSIKIEAALHGKSYYDALVSKLNAAVNEYSQAYGIEPRLINASYSDVWAKYLDQYARL